MKLAKSAQSGDKPISKEELALAEDRGRQMRRWTAAVEVDRAGGPVKDMALEDEDGMDSDTLGLTDEEVDELSSAIVEGVKMGGGKGPGTEENNTKA